MRRKPGGLTAQMEQLIESALAPGRFISCNADDDFVSDLEAVEKQIAGLVRTQPAVAVSLYETFLAGCHEKAEEIDESGGSLGRLAGELFCGWIKARQAAGADPDETAARLLGWMDDDPYGFCFQLEKDVAKVLNKAGLAAFEKQVRARLDTAGSTNYQRRRCGEILRAIYLAQRNVEAFVSLAEATGLTAKDCHDLATMLVSRRKPADALCWVERGLALDKKAPHGAMAGYELANLKRDLLTKLGRGNEALETAWAEYRADPSKYSYEDLMKYVPKAERRSWHEKAVEAATGTDLYSLIELLLATKETERLAALVGQAKDSALQDVGHYATEPAARRLEKTHPELAARLWCAQGMRVLNAKKSKYYDAALSSFERARRCFEKAGLLANWQRVVKKVRAQHHRKTGFLERAKARWGSRQSGGGE